MNHNSVEIEGIVGENGTAILRFISTNIPIIFLTFLKMVIDNLLKKTCSNFSINF